MTEIDPLFESYSCDSLFGQAEVFTLEPDDEGADSSDLLRVLFVGGGFQSATFLGDRRFEPVFAYYKMLAKAIEAFEADEDAPADNRISILLLGSGAYSLPKYVLTNWDNVSIDAVEIDPVIVDLARRYFYVDELEERFAAGDAPRLRSIVQDARKHVLEAPRGAYQIIINDAFNGTDQVSGLLDPQHLAAAHAALTANGIYALNAVVEDCDSPEGALDSIRSALQSEYPNVRHYVCTDEEYAGADNHLFFASDRAFTI